MTSGLALYTRTERWTNSTGTLTHLLLNRARSGDLPKGFDAARKCRCATGVGGDDDSARLLAPIPVLARLKAAPTLGAVNRDERHGVDRVNRPIVPCDEALRASRRAIHARRPRTHRPSAFTVRILGVQ